MPNIESRFEPKIGVEKKEEKEKEKSFTLTVATKEGDFSFEEIPFEKSGNAEAVGCEKKEDLYNKMNKKFLKSFDEILRYNA